MVSTEHLNSEIKFAESQIHQINTNFLSLQSQFSQQWKTLQNSLSKIQSSLQIRFKELESKEQHLNLLQKSITKRQQELQFHEKQFNSSEKFVCNLCKTLGLRVSEVGNVVVKMEPSNEFKDNNCSENDASIKLFVTMDGKTLQMFLNDRVDEHMFIGEDSEEVKSALKLSSDPAKLVLDAMEGFFRPHLKKCGFEYDGSVVRRSCVTLLEQLMELKPEIKKTVREEARALARVWREKMRAEGVCCDDMVVLGFLLLVAVYLLWWDFNKDDLGNLCEVVGQHRVVGELHYRLGFFEMCGVSSMGSQAQKKESYAPPVKNAFVSPSTDPSIELCTLCKRMDGKTVQMFLNYRVNEHESIGEQVQSALMLSCDPAKLVLDAMEGFYWPHLKKGNMEYEGFVVRSSCVLLLEQLMELKPEINKAVREEARALAVVWRDKMRAESESEMVVLGFLLLVAIFLLWWDFDKGELGNLCEVVPQHRVVGELHSRLGLMQKCGGSGVVSQAQKEESYTPPVKNAFVSLYPDRSNELGTICKEMDANGLKSYLIKHEKDLKLLDEKVLECLRCASDPAKLVFNVVQNFYPELDGLQGNTNTSCCSFLLEQLMKLSPHINLWLKEEIMNFATRWKARLAMESTKPYLVFGFLKLLATYKLSTSFQAEEILSLFTIFYNRDVVYESKQIPSLCSALGLEAKVPDLIRSLIKENKWIEAVRCICSFKLDNEFLPDPLLKAYLDYTETAALKKCMNNSSVKKQNKCANKQIRALQSVIRCIFDFKLDSDYSTIDLQQRIRRLERQKEERNSLKQENEKTAKKEKSAPTAPSQSDSKGMQKRAVCHTTAQTHILQECSQEKRPRTDTAQNYVYPSVSVLMASNMNSLHPPSQDYPLFGLHDTGYGMAPNLGSAQFDASKMPYSSICPTVNSTGLHTNIPSGVSHIPRFGTPSSSGYSSKDFHPPS